MSYEICKSVKVMRSTDGQGKWCVRFTGHSNNVYPHTDSTYIGGVFYDSKRDAEADMLRYAHEGMLQGGNRYSQFIESLELGIIRSKTYERMRFYYRLKNRVFHLALYYNPRLRVEDGYPKSEELLARAESVRAKIEDKLHEILLALADEFAGFTPDRNSYNVIVQSEDIGGGFVKSVSATRGVIYFLSTSEAAKRKAKRFSRIAAERFARDHGDRYKVTIVAA